LESAILHADQLLTKYLGVVAACGEFLENEAAAGLMVSLGMAAFPMKESCANFHEKYQ